MMNSHIFLQYGLRDDAVSNFPCVVLQIHQLPEYTQVLFLIFLKPPLPQFFFIILQGITQATDVSNLLRAFLMVSLIPLGR